MFKKIALALVAFLVLIVAIGISFFRSSLFADYLRQKIIAASAEQQVALTLRELSTYFIGLQADSATVLLPRLFLQLDLSKLDVGVHGLIKPWLSAQATAYEGTISTSARPRSDQQVEISLLTKGLSLGSHPALGLFGVRSGLIDVDIPSVWLRRGKIQTLDGKLNVTKLNINARTLQPETTGLPLAISIPEIKDGSIRAKCKVTHDELSCAEFSVNTHELDIQGTLDFWQLNREQSLQLSGQVKLRGKLHELVLPGLLVGCAQKALQCPDSIQMSSTNFEVSIAGRANRPVVTVRPAA